MRALRLFIVLVCLVAYYAGYSSATVSSAEGDDVSRIEIDTDPDIETRPSRVDIYGNDVDDAVEDYRVDPHGELYEQHAPDIALLKLSPASS
jgi:hypothetical protein